MGEGIDVEFKRCWKNIPVDVYETVCAFLNRFGGTIFLGVNDNGEVEGIDPNAITRIRKEFIATVNNPQKIFPPVSLTVSTVEIEGKEILYVFVPASKVVHNCNGRIFDRNDDGDQDISPWAERVATLYQLKRITSTEDDLIPYVGIDDLDRDLIEECRKMATFWRGEHPWRNMDDVELLRSAQFYVVDPQTNKFAVTRGGLAVLGKQSALLHAMPYHRTDLILRRVNIDRYDDRDLVEENLLVTYDRIMTFVRKHLNDPFYLEGTDRISLREAIFREVASNLLIHREYASAFPAKLVIENGQVRTENFCVARGSGQLDINTFRPFPKNPNVSRFFRQIAKADELGSGVRNLAKYCKPYGGEDAQLIEGDIFKTIIKVPDSSGGNGQPRKSTKPVISRPRRPPKKTQRVFPSTLS
jgi:ATP-dependent DNA helicase RecG